MRRARSAEWHRAPRILVIDDEPSGVKLVHRLLTAAKYEDIVTTTDASHSLTLARVSPPDLILLDLHMPGFDGFEVLDGLEDVLAENEFIPVLVLTGDLIAETRRRALTLGATDFLTKPFDNAELVLRIHNLLQIRLLHLSLGQQKDALQDTLSRREAELEEARLEMLERLALAAEVRDTETGRHMRGVGGLAESLALRMGLAEETAAMIGRAAPLHDIGKLGIPDSALLKNGPLSAQETELMQSHTLVGERLLSGGMSMVMQTAAIVARYHHERFDGTGYPDRLSGQAIPLAARIVAVADVFDALAHDRPYRKAWPEEAAIELIIEGSGTHFDPAVVEAFMSEPWVAARIPQRLLCTA
ncbi:MAG: HD domain-containing phosphohydrolase [Gemmatimonadaceae bacterium]